MENKLPKGWAETEFTNLVANVIGGDWGKDPDFEDSDFVEVYCIRGSEIKNWNNNFGDTAVVRKIKKSSLASRCLINGDILLEISGGGPDQPVGRVVLVTKNTFDRLSERPIVCTNFLRLVRPVNHINSNYFCSYLEYFYHSGEVVKYQGGSNNLRNLKYKEYETIGIPLPPLAEQERIVAKLDKLFAQHDKIKKALYRIPELLKAFRQQVLTQAVTGKLTEQWREGKELEDFDQLVCRIINNRNEEYQKSIALAQQKGERKPSKAFLFEKPTIDEIQIKLPQTWGQTNIHFLAYVTKLAGFEYTNHFKVTENGDIPIVRAQNVQMGKFEDKNRLYISKEVSDFLVRSQLHGRELLMVFIGAGTGNVCLAPDNERWHLAPNVAKIDFDFVDRKYMFYYLQSDLGVKNVLSRVKATAQPSLSMETIREIVTIVPPIDEQQEIVRRVENLFSKADTIEARYLTLKAKIDSLPQSILHKAFKGELVPQLPTDGDAKDLLADIMALKKEVKGKVKGKK